MTTLEAHQTYNPTPSNFLASELSGAGIAVPQNATFVSSGITVPDTNNAAAEHIIWQAPQFCSGQSAIQDLIRDQYEWLNGVHRTANDRLYVLHQRCYHLYELMSTDKEMNKQLNDELASQIATRKLDIKESTHTLSKIVKVVFGADRRRASAYCLALQVALAEGIKTQHLPQFFRDAGGIEEVRRKQTNGNAPKVDKIAVAKRSLPKTTLAVVNEAQIIKELDTTKIDDQVILVATQGLNGVLTVNAVVRKVDVVNAVLTALYDENSKAWGKEAASEAIVSASQERADLLNRAANETVQHTAIAA
jgi:hypothetical protein